MGIYAGQSIPLAVLRHLRSPQVRADSALLSRRPCSSFTGRTRPTVVYVPGSTYRLPIGWHTDCARLRSALYRRELVWKSIRHEALTARHFCMELGIIQVQDVAPSTDTRDRFLPWPARSRGNVRSCQWSICHHLPRVHRSERKAMGGATRWPRGQTSSEAVLRSEQCPGPGSVPYRRRTRPPKKAGENLGHWSCRASGRTEPRLVTPTGQPSGDCQSQRATGHRSAVRDSEGRGLVRLVGECQGDGVCARGRVGGEFEGGGQRTVESR